MKPFHGMKVYSQHDVAAQDGVVWGVAPPHIVWAHLVLNTGMGKPVVPDKRVPRVRVWYPIWHTQAKPRTRGAVSWVRAGIYSINLLKVYEFICT